MTSQYNSLVRAARVWDRIAIFREAMDFLRSEASLNLLRYHPLGFIDCVLSDTSEERIQLHIWDQLLSARQDPPNICHSHGWQLRSLVLVGQIVDETYDVRADPNGEYEIYEVRYSSGISISASIEHEPVGIMLERSDPISAGEDYEIESSVFHNTAVGRYPAVTLLVADMRHRVPGRNIRLRGVPSELAYKRVALDPIAATEMLGRVREAFATEVDRRAQKN